MQPDESIEQQCHDSDDLADSFIDNTKNICSLM